MYKLDLALLLLQQVRIFLVIAWSMSKIRLSVPLMQVTVRLPHKLLYCVTFSIFCIMEIYFGPRIEGSIANTRAIGAMTDDLLGGPVAGGLVGLASGLHRYSPGGMAALSYMVSTTAEELLGRLVHSVLVKHGRPDKVFSPLTAGAITFMVELVQMMIILLIARPFQGALHLVQSIAAPIMVTNIVGAALSICTLLDKRVMFGKYASAFPATALKVVASTEGILRQEFNEEDSIKVAQVLVQKLDIGAVAITDHDKLLAFTSIGGDHHLPGKPISFSYTQRAIETGGMVYADGSEVPYRCSIHPHCRLGSALMIPLRGENQRMIGITKLYEAKSHLLSSINRTLGGGIAQLLSAQILAGQYERQKALLTQSEIKLLHTQVDPHFLFNALNTLEAVIRHDSGQTDQLVQYLSTFFRKNLKRPTEIVTLVDEIEHVSAYLQIEKTHFQTNLQIQMAMPEGLAYHQLPAFILQPTVENAVKHGTSRHLGVGETTIHASQDDRWLQLNIKDNTGLYRANPQASGLGMNLVDRHLRARFGTDCGINVTYEPERFTRVTLRLPLEENAC